MAENQFLEIVHRHVQFLEILLVWTTYVWHIAATVPNLVQIDQELAKIYTFLMFLQDRGQHYLELKEMLF